MAGVYELGYAVTSASACPPSGISRTGCRCARSAIAGVGTPVRENIASSPPSRSAAADSAWLRYRPSTFTRPSLSTRSEVNSVPESRAPSETRLPSTSPKSSMSEPAMTTRCRWLS